MTAERLAGRWERYVSGERLSALDQATLLTIAERAEALLEWFSRTDTPIIIRVPDTREGEALAEEALSAVRALAAALGGEG